MRLGAIALLLVVLCLGLIWALHGEDHASPPPASQAAAASAHIASAHRAPTARVDTSSRAEAKANPFATRAEDIAACRQALVAARCRDRYFQRRFARTNPNSPVPDVSPECRGVDGAAPPWRPLYEAAIHGHVPSMARFADGTLFNLGKTYAEWDLEAMALYRQHGYDFLVRAANAGDAGALRKLAREMVTPGRGEGAIPYDRVRGLAYARLLLRHADPDWNSRLTNETIGSAFRFTAEEWAKAEILSRELIPAAAEARLEGWNPNLNGPENDYGCAG